MKTTLTVSLWAACLFLVLDVSFGLINESSSVANFAGFSLLVAFGALSVSTGCFTNIIKKKKDEKDNQND